ncbi:MAG: C10 family peptidase [Bacteroidales bacterium]|nr:C10 family peptidase [Bacteroidales bacterium]
MKKITTFFAMIICAVVVLANPVEPEQASTVALHFMMRQMPAVTRSTECTLAYTKSNDRSDALFYVYNVGGGFVIVSADDAVKPVLGYSTNGSFDPQNIPANCAAWLQDYADQIAYVKEHNLSASETVQQEWTELEEGRMPSRSGNSRAVEPLITTTWDQSPWYNSLCPGEDDDQAVTGCVATAMAQIIKYYEYPAHGLGTHGYTDSYYGDLFVDYENTTYRYDLMPNELDWDTPDEQVNAVATLIRDCGVAVNMAYSSYESSAYDLAARAAFVTQFGYEAHIANKDEDSVWIVMLKEELDQARPIFYSGKGRFWGSNGGHAFICDGYDANDFFHFNFGWSGSYNGFFQIGAITTDDYTPGSNIIGHEGTGFTVNSNNCAVFARPADNTNTILFNYGGHTTRTISEAVQISDAYGFNDYFGGNYSNSYYADLTLYPENEGDQVRLDVLAYDNYFTYSVYDGEGVDDTLLIAERPVAGTTLVSNSGALTIHLDGRWIQKELVLQAAPVSCIPVVRNVTCSHYDYHSATLSWEVVQSEQFPGHTYNWQLEYGPQGFEPGTGIFLHPDSTGADITGLNADTYYDAYITYTCANGSSITLDPFTFKTAPLADCYEPIGTGRDVDYTCISIGYYSWSQQIFTADELAAAGLRAGEPLSILWLQYYGEAPLTRLFGVYMGHTDKTVFANEQDWFDPATLTNVYPETSTTFVNTNTDYWFPLYFSNPFVWDGTSNIVIAYVNSSGTAINNQNFYTHPSSGGCTLYANAYYTSSGPITVENGGSLTPHRLNIKFCSATNCMTPTELTATAVSRTEVQVGWNRMYQENEWTVEYGLTGFEHGHGTTVTVTGNPTTLIGNLEYGMYDFYVRANCGGGNYSDWRMVSAHVMGSNDCAEYIGNDLSSGNLVSAIDRSYNYSQSQQIFTADALREMGVMPGEPMYALSVQYNYSTSVTRKMAVYMANTEKTAFANSSDWFNTGVLTNVFPETNFTFQAKEDGENYRWATFNFEVPYVWDGTSNVVVAFTDNTGTAGSTNYSDNRFYQHTGNANNTLFWRGSELPTSSSYGYTSNYLSNIRLCEGCMHPVNITYETPSRHEIVFTWHPGHEETEWRVEYGLSGFEQGTGTMVTVSGEPTLTISQLGRGGWDFYFASDCGNGNSSLWKKVSVIMGEGNTECFQIGNGTVTNNTYPIGYGSSDNYYTYVQELYTADELSSEGLTAGGIIQSLSFQYSGSSKSKDPITIWLAHTSRTSMTTNAGFIPTSEMQQVFYGEVNMSEGWINIPLDRSFVWDGSSNVVVAVLNNSGNTDDRNTVFYGSNLSGYALCRNTWQTIDPDNSSCSTLSFRNNILFCSDNGCALQRTLDAIVNEGDSYDFYGRSISEQGTYTHRFYVDEECDSLITLNLTVRKIIYVTPTGAGSHSGESWQHAMELQEAMDTANTYTDVTPFIYVKKGTYTGNTSGANSFEIKGNVRAYGGFNGNEGPYFDLNDRNPSNVSTLNGSNARRVLYQSEDFTADRPSLFDGFTIRGGTVDNVGEGGAAYIRQNCTLRNCKITANNASISGTTANITRSGVAVYNNGGRLENCEIYNNNITLSGTGSGHKVWGVGVYSTNGTIENCTLRNNTTVYDGAGNNWNVYGGGIYLENDNTLTNSSITLNSASDGGGVCVRNTNNSTFVSVSNCIISNNTARGNGGGVNVYNSNNGVGIFTQCLIGNNVSGGNGGGIYDGNNSVFNSCDIVRNAAATNAGGVYSYNGTTFKNSIIWGNKVGNNANHIAAANGKYFTFVNSAFPGYYSGALTLQEENSGTGMGYPNFTNPTAEAGADANNAIGDWTLQEGSFCIGLGNNSLSTTETDLNGNDRIQQARVDIGAFESAFDMAFPLHPETPSNIIYVTTTGAGLQDGSSWSNATSDLQYAMVLASGCTPPASVWVAKGTYTCERPYIVHPNVAVYGSFAGNEPYNYDLSQRDFENNATILDGDRLYRVLDKTCPFAATSNTTYYTESVTLNMPATGSMDITACEGTIYDDGGPNGNFSPNCNGEIIIRSYNPYSTITLSGNYNNNYSARLKIYDGVGGRELGNYNYDGTVSLTSTSGVLVVQFTSGSGSLTTGFALQFTCSDCEPEAHESTVDFRNGESLFDGFTVQNGYDRNASFGGGYLLAHTDLLNCTFTNNLGSGVHVEESAVENCTFTHNGAKGFDGRKLTIRNCRSAHNSTYGISGSELTISNCVVEDNSSDGIYYTGNCDVENSIIRNNRYGIYLYSGSGKISGCTISGNRSYGIYNGSSNTQVFNTSIINNDGTGLYAYGGLYVNVNVANNTGIGVYASNGAQFTNCHIVKNLYNNNSSTTGAGVSNGNNGTNQFTNCVIWGNKTKNNRVNISGTNATYAYCAVEGGVDGTANITLDTLNSGDEPGAYYPNFANPSDTAGAVGNYHYDYTLAAGSACINQGIANTTSLNLPMYDLAGSLRIKQGRIDIGAYEYGGLIVNRVSDTICLGEDFWYGDEYVYPEEAGLYLDTFTYYENNIDYIAYISLQTNENYNILIDTAICEGESVFFDGEARTETGEYTAYEYTSTGCDSTVTLNLTVLPHSSSSFSATACDSYTWNNETYYESGDYQQLFVAANGCDSTVTLHLTINGSSEYEFDQTACMVHNWNGISYRQSGDYTQTFRNHAGCDSTVTMHLTILDVLETEFSATACDSYTWNNETYTTSGDKVQYLESSLGCDSIVTLHLTINRSKVSTERLTACDSYTWNDETYAESGIYQQVFTAANGCDSTVTLHLTVNHTNEYEFADEACDTYVWNNQTYEESGDYQQVLTNAGGCDSTVTLHLTIHHSNSYEFADEACDRYVWNNQTYEESGDYQQVLTNAEGCDSTVTLHLTIHHSNSYEFADEACDSYIWNNQTYEESGDYQQVLTNAEGCDSTVTLHLTIHTSTFYEFTDEGCDRYVWNNQTYEESGDYQQTFTNATGCDSIVTLHLTIHPTYQTQLEETICQGDLPYHYTNGLIDTTFDENTPELSIFNFHFSTFHGCDSTVTLTFHVTPVTTPQLVVDGIITACQSSSATLSVDGNYTTFNWSNGATTPTISVTTPGYYWVELIDINGCYSISEVEHLGISELIPETPAICMVGVENGHNLIVWEEIENTNVQNYRIYRENDQADVYELLATVPASQGNSYEDLTADPTVRAWRYKVTAMDVCQGETPMSELHKTVHLTINQGIGNTWNLIWTHYEGMEFASYRLYRGTTNADLQQIATLPATLTSYTDYDNVNGALFYQIEVVMNGTCLRRSETYTGARSNIVYNGEMVYTDTTVSECEEYEWFGTTYTQSGDYQHVYTSDLGYDCTATLHLTLFTMPSISISGNTDVLLGESTTLSVTSNPQWTYLWSTGETTSSITVTPEEPTTYSVTVTNGTCEAEASVDVSIHDGIPSYDNNLLTLYPNPTNDIVNVRFTNGNGKWENTEIRVYDVYGRLLQTVETCHGASLQTTQIDLSHYATGVYLIQLVNNGNVMAVRKAVKE